MSLPSRQSDCHPDRKHVARGLCRPCYHRLWYAEHREESNARSRRYAVANRDKTVAIAVASNRRRRYGITAEQYEALVVSQGGVCAVCHGSQRVDKNGKPRQLAVDHDHQTGRVRGLLCFNCNTAVGHLRDDPVLALAVSLYLGSGES